MLGRGLQNLGYAREEGLQNLGYARDGDTEFGIQVNAIFSENLLQTS